MIKKAYITPGTEVQTVEIQHLLVPSITTTGTDNITGDPNADESDPNLPDNDNRSRRRTYNCWEDIEEEEEEMYY